MGVAVSIRTTLDATGNEAVRVYPANWIDPPAPARQRGTVAWRIPYTRVDPRTVAAAPIDAVWTDVSAGSDAYWGALCEWWATGETFAILEHDIVCRSRNVLEIPVVRIVPQERVGKSGPMEFRCKFARHKISNLGQAGGANIVRSAREDRRRSPCRCK